MSNLTHSLSIYLFISKLQQYNRLIQKKKRKRKVFMLLSFFMGTEEQRKSVLYAQEHSR